MSNSHTGKSSDEKNYDTKIGIFSDKWRMLIELQQGQVATDAELQCLKVARLADLPPPPYITVVKF